MNYYNEFDPKAAAWLRQLIHEGRIAPGEVDERSITDVKATDLVGYDQIHLFAGIGGWSYALRLAGWPDRKRVFTCSCPCPPFSSAGKKKACPNCRETSPVPCPWRTGVFICCACEYAWIADARHLWPEAYRLIAQYGPATIFGEQVAGKDGRLWFAGVRATLELLGYAVGAMDLAAGSVGAPHVRQRLYWVANASSARYPRTGKRPAVDSDGLHSMPQRGNSLVELAGSSSPCMLADSDGQQPCNGNVQRSRKQRQQPQDSRDDCRLGDSSASGRQGSQHQDLRGTGGRKERGTTAESSRSPGRLGHTDNAESQRFGQHSGEVVSEQESNGHHASDPWSRFDLLPCGDGKQRRVESGTFPLAHGIPHRVVKLRGYGNAIVPQVAAEFIKAFVECREE